MKALLIRNKFSVSDSYQFTLDRIVTELGKKKIKVDVMDASSFNSVVGKKNDLSKKYAFAIYYDKDRYYSMLLEQSGLRLFNNSRSIELCDDKMLTHIELNKFGVSQPITIPGILCYFKDGKYSVENMKEIEKVLSYPIVFKLSYGSLGKGVYLAKNRKELLKIANEHITEPHLFQEFIKESKGTDYRVIVIGGKAVAWMKRESKVDFRSNCELGGQAIKCEISSSIKKLAEKTAKVLKLDYCGVDILVGKNNTPFVCEVNSNAFVANIEKTTGVNVMQLYVEHILNKIKRS